MRRNGATKRKPKREVELDEVRELSAILDDYDLAETQQNFEFLDQLRKTLLRTLLVSGTELVDLALHGTVKDAQAFAELADDGPNLCALLRHTSLLIELASTRLRAALELRDDHKELFEHSAAQLRKGLS